MRYIRLTMIGILGCAWIAVGGARGEPTLAALQQATELPPTTDPEVLRMPLRFGAGDFAENAFPPTMPDTDWHREGWIKNDCLRCHETGVESAPVVRHEGLPVILMAAKCRSCHVIEAGKEPTGQRDNTADPAFEANAFPPMMPNSAVHRRAWISSDCVLCHEDGVMGAPLLRHEGLPPIYLDVKCRSCHVQVRSHETEPWGPGGW
jgi:cytochrome c5